MLSGMSCGFYVERVTGIEPAGRWFCSFLRDAMKDPRSTLGDRPIGHTAGIPRDCPAEALQAYPNYRSSVTLFGADSSNIADRTAELLANRLGSEAGDMRARHKAASASLGDRFGLLPRQAESRSAGLWLTSQGALPRSPIW